MKRLISTTALSLVAGFALGATGAVADATKTDRDAMTGANVKSEAQSDPSGSGLTSAGSHGGSNPPGSGLTGAGGNDPVAQTRGTTVPTAPAGAATAADSAATNTGRDAQTGDRYTTDDPEGSGLTSAGSQAEADPDGSGLTGAGQAAATETDRDAKTGG